MIRVVVVDDDRFARDNIATLVDDADDITVVGKAANGQEALILADTERPDVILMDVRMQGIDGVEATSAVIDKCIITDNDQPVRIIILTAYHADDAVYAALRAGASGFCLKDAVPTEIVSAIRAVAAGGAWLDPAVTRKLIDNFNHPHQNNGHTPHTVTSAQMDQLTTREKEVLILLAGGASTADIAEKLGLSEATVKTHLANMMKKIGVRQRMQAVIAAYQNRLVQP